MKTEKEIYDEGYRQGRMDAAESVRNASLLLGPESVVNLHFLTSAAEG